ncbi:MAG: Spy/CpxP family protein refolding chaperone [Candidatus Omnitrophota bacterium]
MMKKGLWVIALALVMAVSPVVSNAFAYGGGHPGGPKDDLAGKLMMKCGFLMKSQEEIGLSDEQIRKIKDIKMRVKKDLISKKAAIELLAVDIKSMLWEDKIDTKAIDKLIDQKYDIKKEKAKNLVAAYAELKSVLTDEQRAKAKKLWSDCEKKCWKK